MLSTIELVNTTINVVWSMHLRWKLQDEANGNKILTVWKGGNPKQLLRFKKNGEGWLAYCGQQISPYVHEGSMVNSDHACVRLPKKCLIEVFPNCSRVHVGGPALNFMAGDNRGLQLADLRKFDFASRPFAVLRGAGDVEELTPFELLVYAKMVSMVQGTEL